MHPREYDLVRPWPRDRSSRHNHAQTLLGREVGSEDEKESRWFLYVLKISLDILLPFSTFDM
jgi:hypothetical protein